MISDVKAVIKVLNFVFILVLLCKYRHLY